MSIRTGYFARASAVAFRAMADETKARQGAPLYVSAKRTHFIFARFSTYLFHIQNLMSFAAAFANGFVWVKRNHFGGDSMPQSGKQTQIRWNAEVQMEIYGRKKCAVGRPAHNMGTRGDRRLNFLEVVPSTVYAPPSSLRRFCLNHVGAGNAVKFGNSGAAVTGYESPTPKVFGVKSHPNGEGGRVGLPRNTSG